MYSDLKYGDVYEFNINKENYKGIYLGNTPPRKNLKLNYVFLVKKESGDLVKFPYSLIRAKNYRFNEENKLILQRMSYILPQNNEREYLEELLDKIR